MRYWRGNLIIMHPLPRSKGPGIWGPKQENIIDTTCSRRVVPWIYNGQLQIPAILDSDHKRKNNYKIHKIFSIHCKIPLIFEEDKTLLASRSLRNLATGIVIEIMKHLFLCVFQILSWGLKFHLNLRQLYHPGLDNSKNYQTKHHTCMNHWYMQTYYVLIEG